MRCRVHWGALVLFLFLFPTVAFSQSANRGEFSKDIERLFLSESATISDAENIVSDLYSTNDKEFAKGLYFSKFVVPRFPSLRDRIESKLVHILNNKRAQRFFQGAETALAIAFSKENAEKLIFEDKDLEMNLIKALIKEKAGVETKFTPEQIVSEIERESGNNSKHLVDENSLKESFFHCNQFKEIIEIAVSMKFFGLADEFSRIVAEHPMEFDGDTIIFAADVLGKGK